MKNYVCDFCDAFTVGYEHFKKEFNSVRHARLIAKNIKGNGTVQACDLDTMKKIKDIREESKTLYDPKKCFLPKDE